MFQNTTGEKKTISALVSSVIIAAACLQFRRVTLHHRAFNFHLTVKLKPRPSDVRPQGSDLALCGIVPTWCTLI